MKDKNVDVIVRGEGEVTFLDIVKNIETEKDIHKIPGTIVRKNNEIIYNKDRSFIKNIDSLPFPARHLLPMGIYFKNQEKNFPFNMRVPYTSMITSRGCPYNCIYCDIKTV